MIDLVKSIGAGKTVDYTKEDFTALGESFDIIFDAVGKISRSSSKKLLKPTGRYVSVNGQAKPTQQDLVFIRELIEAGKLTTVIDRTYTLDEIQSAHRYVEQFRKRGNVSVRVTEA